MFKISKMFKKVLCLLLLISSVSFSLEIDFKKEDLSVIRKLQVYKNPIWVAQIKTVNNQKLLFSSPKSMLEFYFAPKKFPSYKVNSSDDIEEILLTDYKSSKIIKARSAYYVYGSNVTSPSGDDLVSFSTQADAKEFAKVHNGKRIFRFSKIPYALIKLLNGDI